MKKISVVLIILLSVLCVSSFAFASTTNEPRNVYPTNAKVLVNGTPIEFEAYLIDGNNYFKLRDIAIALVNTNESFSVMWDERLSAILLQKGASAIEAAGGKITKGDGKPKQAILNASRVFSPEYVQLNLTAYTINGNNFFKLRDIADAMQFNVTWSASASAVSINTTGFYGLTPAEKITYKEPVNTGTVLTDKVNDSEFVGYYYDGGTDIIQITNDGIYNIFKKDGVYQTKPIPNNDVTEPPFKAYDFTKAPYRYLDFGITIMVNTTSICHYKDDYKVLVITKNNKGVPCAGLTYAEGYYLKNYKVIYEWIGTSLADVEPFFKKKELQKELEKADKEEKEKIRRAALQELYK